MKFILTVVICFLVSTTFSQQISQNDVRTDLRFLVESIDKFNPAIKKYNSDFHQDVNEIITRINEDVSLFEYFKMVSKICALSNEGHLNIVSSDQYPIKGILDNSYKYFPFTVKIFSGRIYVQNSFSKEQLLAPGDEIISLNEKSADSILNSIYGHTPSDGFIISNLEHLVTSGFPWMYFSYVEQAKSYTIEYKSHNSSDVSTIKIDALTRSEQIENLVLKKREKKKTKEKSIDDFYEFEIFDDHAYLRLKSFDHKIIDLYDLEADDFYEELFQKLREKTVENLIIDLRYNTGGRFEFADEIVPYILKNEPDQYLRKSISWKGKVKTYKFPKANSLVFNGKIITIINGKTYSSGAVLARYLKEYGDAFIIGQETGSRYEGFAAGSQQQIILPNSKLKIGIPRYLTTFPISKKQETDNRGLLPDLEIENEIKDFLEDIDRPLLEAEKIIKNH